MRPPPLIILTAVVAVFFVTLTVVRGPIDADYWWHLETGEQIIQLGRVPGADLYSFAYDGPWITHEWLGEVLIYTLVSTLGFPLTAALFGLVIAAALMVPAVILSRATASSRAVLPVVVVGMYAMAAFATVRPQALSWLMLGIVVSLLVSLRPEHVPRAWIVPLLVVIWANLHGLWVVGTVTIGVYSAFTLLGRTPMATRKGAVLAMFAASAVAGAVTPSGLAGLVYPLRYLRPDDWGTAFIAEWQPADVTDPRQWGLVLVVLAAVALVRRGVPGWMIGLGMLGIGAGIAAVRNQPLTMILAMPMLATALNLRLRPARHSPAVEGGRRTLELGLAAVVIAAIVIVLPRVASGSVASAYPVDAFDELLERRPDARAFVDYDWGGYAIHRLASAGGSVFIDGRSDMYPRAVFDDYLAIRSGSSGWEGLVRSYGVDMILLPPSAPVIRQARGAGWCERYADERAVLLEPCATGRGAIRPEE